MTLMNPDGTFTCYTPIPTKKIELSEVEICYKGITKERFCGCSRCVAERHARVAARRRSFQKPQATHTIADRQETAEDYQELIHICDLRIWQILETKEMAESKLATLEGNA